MPCISNSSTFQGIQGPAQALLYFDGMRLKVGNLPKGQNKVLKMDFLLLTSTVTRTKINDLPLFSFPT